MTISYLTHIGHLENNELLTVVSSSMSFFATLIMIAFYLAFQKLRKSSRDYLLMINICDCVCAVCFLFSGLDISLFNNELDMIIKGFVIQFFYLSSFCWTTCYSIHLLQLVIYHNEIPARHWANQLMAWTPPVLSLIGLSILLVKGTHIIGDSNRLWPWIANDLPCSFLLQMSFLYIPISILFLINIYCYIRICWKSRGEAMHISMFFRCMAYGLVPVLTIGWSGVDRVYFFLKQHQIRNFSEIIAFAVPLLGFLNVCVYSLNKYFFNSFKRQQKEIVHDGAGELMEETIPFTVAVTMN